MTHPKRVETSSAARHEPRDLLARTLRTTAILVGACVLFVGSLSTAAVLIANKATSNAGVENGERASDAPSTTPSKPTSTTPHAGPKSQSI